MKEIKKLLIDNEIISKDGLKVNGVGILIKKFDKMIEMQDKTNLKLFYVEDKLKKIMELVENKNI